jgi:hypothetical protein
MGEIKLGRQFVRHVRPAYAYQVTACGCSWDSLTGKNKVGDLCESRLTGPRCDETEGCTRPKGHWGSCG